MKKKRLLIIECTRKLDKADEYVVLKKFLEMTIPKYIKTKRILSKQGLVNYLKNKKDLHEFDYIHLSGHGHTNECVFITPKGSLAPEDFPKDCFSDKTVTISACFLGKKDFIQQFMNQTSAREVIAPQRVVYFVDAALWFVTFYYHALHISRRPKAAYDQTEKALENVKGAFQFWS